MSNAYILSAILVMCAVTAAIRFIPFFIFSGSRKTPAVVTYLGGVFPYAVMAMLVVYCFKNISFSQVSGFVPSLIATAVVVALHVWKRNTLLSILAGTLCYMFLVQVVF